MNHTCHAIDCTKQVPPKMFMCLKHWRMVPKKLQITVWNQYRPGQEIDKQPSLYYLSVQQMAVAEVARLEGKIEQASVCFQDSLKYGTAAKEAGEVWRG